MGQANAGRRVRVLVILMVLLLAGCVGPATLPDEAPEVWRDALRVETAHGSFIMVLYVDEAPETSAQLMALAQSGFYNGSLFDRIVDNFVIQGGAPPLGRTEAPKLPLETHPDLYFASGTVGIARDADPESGTSIFFVCEYPQPHLRDPQPGVSELYGKFTAFAQIVQGMDVVRRVAAVPTVPGLDRPVSNVPMTVTVEKVLWTEEDDRTYPLRTLGRVTTQPYRISLEAARVIEAGVLPHFQWFVESTADRTAQTNLAPTMRVTGAWEGVLALEAHPEDGNVHRLAEPFPVAGSYALSLYNGLTRLATFDVDVG